jgi:hypothetical protein
VWYEQLTKLDFDRFKLASQAFRRYGSQLDEGYLFFDTRSRNNSGNMLKISKIRYEGFSLVVGFFLAGLFYGGVHLVVWNRPFRGENDELLWKLSSITILVSGIPAVIWYVADILNDYSEFSPAWHNIVRMLARNTSLYASAACFCLSMPLYIFARIFIVVECFLDVFHLPDSAFEVPQWSQYFPHVG